MRDKVLDFEEAVLDIVGLIPAGKVLTYGDIAEILEKGGPRQVGAVMARGSAGVPWWRVIRADGRPPLGLEAVAVEHYLEELTALRGAPNRWSDDPALHKVDLMKSRWNPSLDEQATLQRIRAGLEAGIPGGRNFPSDLSEADDGVDS